MTTVVGISGPSCSGKSSLAKDLMTILPECTVLEQDWFFKSPIECPPDANFCDLRYLDVPAFKNAALALVAGRSCVVPKVDFRTFECTGSNEISPSAFLVIEGMTIFRIAEVHALCTHRFYLSPTFDVLATRKRSRDAVQRAKSTAVIEAQLKWMRSEYERDLDTAVANELTLISEDNWADTLRLIAERVQYQSKVYSAMTT